MAKRASSVSFRGLEAQGTISHGRRGPCFTGMGSPQTKQSSAGSGDDSRTSHAVQW